MIKNLPNFITCINLLFGCLGIMFLFGNDPFSAAMCIWLAALCDFLDGFVARAVNAQSNMGKELDSLADVVSFGVLPAFIWFYYLGQTLYPGTSITEVAQQDKLPYITFFMALCSAWRLAKFNIDDRQTDHFRGVPTPANALVWSAFPFISAQSLFPLAQTWILDTWFVLGFGILMSILLLVDWPLIAFKFKSWSLKENKFKYGFLLLAIVLLALYGANAIFPVFFLYLLASWLEHK